MSYLFIVDHFINYPSSDGGLWNVIAEDDEDCFDVITRLDGDENLKYYPKLRENIQNSQRFLLAEELESEVIESFIT
jgi:hypothetical protein